MWQDNAAQNNLGSYSTSTRRSARVRSRTRKCPLECARQRCRLHATRLGLVADIHHRRNILLLWNVTQHVLSANCSKDGLSYRVAQLASQRSENRKLQWGTAATSINCHNSVSFAAIADTRRANCWRGPTAPMQDMAISGVSVPQQR